MISDKNPLIGIVGPADTMTACAQVLAVVDLATGADEDDDRDDLAMGYHLVLTTVRNALEWEAEHLHERMRPPPTAGQGKVSRLPGSD